LSLAAATFIVIASSSSGFPVSHVTANDGSVWLTENTQGDFGQFDYPITQLAAAFGPPSAFENSYDLDVLQQGTTVLAVDENRSEVYPVNVQQGGIEGKGLVMPGGKSAHVALGGDVAAVLDASTGKVWAGVVEGATGTSLSSLNVSGAPTARLHGATSVAVTSDGTVLVASPKALLSIPEVDSTLGSAVTSILPQRLGPQVDVTAVGDVPALLDETHHRVVVPSTDETVTLPSSDTSSDFVLQQVGPASSSVLVASNHRLYSISLRGGKVTTLVRSENGMPAAPVRLDTCVQSAWGGSPGEYVRSCDGAAQYRSPLPGVRTLGDPVFRVNNNDIMLNDQSDGAAWDLGHTPTLALNNGNWLRILDGLRKKSTNPSSSLANQTTSAAQNDKPKAVDEQFDVRAGRTSVLHVLDEDSDPAGSVLSVASISPASGSGYTAVISPDSETVAVTLTSSIPVHFQYSIVDARGESASAAITVTPTASETPPHLRSGYVPQTRYLVSGGSATYQVLNDWRDDQSDPVSVSDATVSQGTIGWTGDGLLTYTAPTETTNTDVTLNYDVTDGLSAPVSGHVSLVVLARGSTTPYPPVAMPDVASVTVGQPLTITPLLNDIPGADPLHPSATLALAGPVAGLPTLAVSTNVAAGTLTLTASQAGVYALTYQDAFGSAPLAQTQILVSAHAPAGSLQEPVVLPTSVLLRGQLPSTVNVLTNDYDPAGGLLSVVGVTAPTGLEATVVNGAYLRIESTAPSLTGQHIVTYQVTNGTTEPVPGQVTVTWQPPITPGPPVAPDVTAVVRAGGETDVPVLAADSDPAGEPLSLMPSAVTLNPADAGSASVTGGDLRYAAPASASVTAPEQVEASYVVEDTSGEQTTGHVELTVNPVKGRDLPADPPALEARVVAGGTVVIPVPTSGIDPDGDSDAVTGVIDSPQLGRILSIQQGSITYQAYPLSGGTDTFTYQVEDTFGLTAQATVRVAVSPPGQAQAPIAVDDDVTAAPGAHLSVDILANDVIANGDQITVLPLTSTNATLPAGASLDGQELDVVAPSGDQTEVVTYGITDGTSTPSLAQVTVHSQPNYIVPPVAIDDYAKAPQPGQTDVSVNVLANDYDPAGTSGDLTITQVFDSAAQKSGPDVVIPVSRDPQAVAYEIRNPEGGTAVGVVHVPAGAGGPQLRANASTIQVPKDGSVSVDINNYISDTTGQVRLTTSNEILVSPTNGLSWQPSSYSAITLTGTNDYIGPASLTVQVTDGTSANESGAQTAFITLPVQVGPPTPVLRCPTTPVSLVEGGPSVSLDLLTVCQVWTPEADQAASLQFTDTGSSPPTGVSLSWSDAGHQTLTITPGSDSVPGGTGQIQLGISGTSASAKLTVIVTKAPLATVAPISVPGVETGHTATIDLRQYVTSPLAQPDIQVTSVTQTSSGTAAVTHSGSVVQITPQTGTHGIMTFSVQVTDVANRPDRTVTGEITLQVLDKPGQPGPILGTPTNDQVALTWTAADPNGAPVEYYELSISGQTVQVPGTSYVATGLTNGTPYQFSVYAVNQVGDGEPTATATYAPQSVPGVPGSITATPGDGQVALSWGAAISNGPTINNYIISVTPAPSSGSAEQQISGQATSYTWSGLDNNVGPYTFNILAVNELGPGPSVSSSPVYAYGTPATPSAPTATGEVSLDQSTTTATVSWPAVSLCNDAQPCASYVVTEYKGGSVVSTTTSATTCGADLCASFGQLANDSGSYTYAVQDVNSENVKSAISSQSSAVVAVGHPGTPTGLSDTTGNQSMTVTFTIPAANGSGFYVEYASTPASVSGSWSDPGAAGTTATETINGLTNGDTYNLVLTACNDSECGTPSAPAPSVVPYGPPDTPQAYASESGSGNTDTLTFGWSGGGDNGRPLDHYNVCINGTCSSQSAPGSTSVSANCGTGAQTITVFYVDTAGQTSSQASASASPAGCPPPPTIVIGWPTGQSSGSGLITMTLNNFPVGSTQQFYCHFTYPSVETTGPYSVYIGSSTYTPPESGNCHSADNNDTVTVTIGNVTSNTISVN
jgi:hypothetical protein